MSVQIQVSYETNGELAEIVHLLSGVLDRVEYNTPAEQESKKVMLFLEEQAESNK